MRNLQIRIRKRLLPEIKTERDRADKHDRPRTNHRAHQNSLRKFNTTITIAINAASTVTP